MLTSTQDTVNIGCHCRGHQTLETWHVRAKHITELRQDFRPHAMTSLHRYFGDDDDDNKAKHR